MNKKNTMIIQTQTQNKTPREPSATAASINTTILKHRTTATEACTLFCFTLFCFTLFFPSLLALVCFKLSLFDLLCVAFRIAYVGREGSLVDGQEAGLVRILHGELAKPDAQSVLFHSIPAGKKTKKNIMSRSTTHPGFERASKVEQETRFQLWVGEGRGGVRGALHQPVP